MRNQAGSLAVIASILFAGTAFAAAAYGEEDQLDLGFSASISPVSYETETTASETGDTGSAAADPPKSKTKKNSQNDVSLNNHFDTFEIEPPTGIGVGINYAGNNTGIAAMSSVRDGLLSAEQKKIGKFYADGWVTGSAFDHNEWPVTNGYDENYNGRSSSVSPYQLSQAYVTMGREVEYGNHLSIGAKIDALYGADYLLASSLGLEKEKETAYGAAASSVYAADSHWNKNSKGGDPEYGFAIPQAYVEAYAPVMGGLTAQVGHFYSPMGYESICSPNNFFHTHSYTMLYGQPQTLTGATMKLRLNNQLSILGGAHQGWNTFSDNNSAWDVIAGITLDGNPGDSLKFIVSTGDAITDNLYNRRTRRFITMNGNQTSYSLVLQKQLCEEVTWVLEHDLGIMEDGAFEVDQNCNIRRKDAAWYSVANYLYFSLTETLDFGARAEWFCDHNHSRLLYGEPLSSQIQGASYKWDGENLFDISLGLNWRPTRAITIRPEVRWDTSDIELTDAAGNKLCGGIYDEFSEDNRLTFGGDVIVHF